MNTRGRHLSWRYRRLYKRIMRAACSKLYRDSGGDIRNSIMVAGTARSGTTWLASIIASQRHCRIMFEPFNPRKVEAFRQFHYFQYMRPAEENNELWSYCRQVFAGDIRHSWIDREVDLLKPQYRLIKEIRANLFLRWISLVFPEIPLLFIVRHPCAVVSSRMQLGWATDTDIESFLAQPKLIEDHLKDKVDSIRQAETIEEKHAIIWCISNLVPLKQFSPNDLNVIFYENLVLQPEIEIPRLFQAIHLPYRDTVFARAGKPSTTAIQTSAVVTGENRITGWRKTLSPVQIRNILAVVEAFELDYIYGESVMPLTQH